eukprot:GHRQ01021030.1.p2 GENE.GHRQ01021030.1~~GHRQ01021030.1.p2  ORF type:complete len:134 (-),score=17.93 GHRQ01021030.1:137-538(-)
MCALLLHSRAFTPLLAVQQRGRVHCCFQCSCCTVCLTLLLPLRCFAVACTRTLLLLARVLHCIVTPYTDPVSCISCSGVDVYTAVAGAVGALYGPLHGGANEAVLRMLERIGSVDNIPSFIAGVLYGVLYDML